MKKTGFFRGSFILAGLIVFCCSWGFFVHRTVHQLAVYQLRGDLRDFFFDNMDYIVKESVTPDLRRNKDSTEASKHFIDLEVFGDSAAWKMPWSWEEAVQQYSVDTLLKYGTVPYQIIILKNKLTEAFKNKNKDSILFYAADLGHYIGDAHVPLHTTINYDGQLSNQKGLHSLWETVIPEIKLDDYDLYSGHKASYLNNPAEEIWKAIRSSHVLLEELFRREKEVSALFTDATKYRIQIRNGKEYKYYTSEFAKAYSAKLGSSINDQLLASANLVADFWYTCYVDAGKPDLDSLGEINKAEKKELRKQVKMYKNNGLLQSNLLISRQTK